MSGEFQLQVRPKDTPSSLSLSKAHSSLIARGRRDVIALTDGDQHAGEGVAHGYREEQFTLGTMYENGDGVTRDYVEAARWYAEAAEAGYADAQFSIGTLYTHGQGVEPDHTKAAEWYLKAAKQGHGFAQFNIGVMYQNGDGVEHDYSLATRWYRLAAEWTGEDPPSFDPRALCEQDGTEEARDSAEASKWYLRVLSGVAAAQFNLGLLYEAGAGVSQDYLLAYMWMKLAADRVGDSERFAAGRDRILAKMTGTEAAEAERLEEVLRNLAEKREQEVAVVMAALKRSLEARRSAGVPGSQEEETLPV